LNCKRYTCVLMEATLDILDIWSAYKVIQFSPWMYIYIYIYIYIYDSIKQNHCLLIKFLHCMDLLYVRITCGKTVLSSVLGENYNLFLPMCQDIMKRKQVEGFEIWSSEDEYLKKSRQTTTSEREIEAIGIVTCKGF